VLHNCQHWRCQCDAAWSGADLRQGARGRSLDFQSLGDAGENCCFDAGFGDFRDPRIFTDAGETAAGETAAGEEFQGF
jgi:hypothetical protein